MLMYRLQFVISEKQINTNIALLHALTLCLASHNFYSYVRETDQHYVFLYVCVDRQLSIVQL